MNRFLSYKYCEVCGKDIVAFVGYFWIPKDGPLKGDVLYFDTEECKKDYIEVYTTKGGLLHDLGSGTKA